MPHFELKDANKALLIAEGKRLLNLIQGEGVSEKNYAQLYQKAKIDEIIDLREIVENSQNQDPNWLSLKAAALSRTSTDESKRVDYLTAVVCVAWALSDICTQNGVDVKRGSYTILGDDRVYEFFLDYVKFATNSNDPGFFTNASCFAYRRDPKLLHSSHYKKDSLQYGIDLRFGLFQDSLPILPHGHSHLLFGRINSGHGACVSTFFKFEPKGMGTLSDLAHHGVDYANSGTVNGVSHREKDVPEELKKTYTGFCAEAKIPAKSKYMHDMWHDIKNTTVDEESAASKLKEEFLQQASDKFKGSAHLDFRFGSEAIMRLNNNNPVPKNSNVMSVGILHLFPQYQSYFKSKPVDPIAGWEVLDSEVYDSDSSTSLSDSTHSDSSTTLSSSGSSTPETKSGLSSFKFW